jgi:hypothetical protein
VVHATARATILAVALVAAGVCHAAGASGQFDVNISLSTGGGSNTPTPPPSGICISQSQSEQTGAIVRVVCQTGQFVSIGPRPGGRFIDTHGGAYAYYLGPLSSSPLSAGDASGLTNGLGTIASLRVYAGEGTGVLDMLISF